MDLNEFVIGLRGDTEPERDEIIKRAFKKLDTYDLGCVQTSDLEAVFQFPRHPKVASGEMTSQEVFSEFLATFVELGQFPSNSGSNRPLTSAT